MLFKKYYGNRKKVEKLKQQFLEPNLNLIPYKELKAVPIGEELKINKGISTIRLGTKSSDSLSFRVTMEPHTEWGLHMHDCDETILMYQGQAVDKENNNKLERGGYYFIKKNKAHKIIALDKEVIFYVEFKQPV